MDFSMITPARSRTCVLKVYLHCPACENKVHKELKKIRGVRTITIDREHGKVTVSGAIDPYTLQRALAKIGKRAEILWDSSGSRNQNHCIQFSTSNQTQLDPEQLDQFSQIEGLKEVELTHKKTIKMTFKDNSCTSKFVNADHDHFYQQPPRHQYHHGGTTSQSGSCFNHHYDMMISNSNYYGGGNGCDGPVEGCGWTRPALPPAEDHGCNNWVGGSGAPSAPPPRQLPPPRMVYSRPSVFCDENPNSCTVM